MRLLFNLWIRCKTATNADTVCARHIWNTHTHIDRNVYTCPIGFCKQKKETNNKSYRLRTANLILIAFEFCKFCGFSNPTPSTSCSRLSHFSGGGDAYTRERLRIVSWQNEIAILGLLKICLYVFANDFGLKSFLNSNRNTTAKNHQTLLQHLNVLKCDLTHSKIKYSDTHIWQKTFIVNHCECK